HVVALSASVVSGGWNSVYGAIQVIPDSELKLFHVDPVSGILDYDADDKVRAIFRFSKAIDLYAPNEQRFHVTDGQGQVLPFALDITGNQAEITLTDVSALTVGDRLVVTIDAGLSSVKPLTETNVISLYKLKKTQTQTFIYRGRTAADLWIDSVLPRRQTVGKALDVTMSVHGLPLDKARVRAWIGDQPISITSLESNDEEERVGILYGTSPALNIPGYYDVRVDINRYGIWETTRLLGAVAVDAPLTLNSVIPQWGPLAGGTRVEITGTGFEPGNTVADGIHMLIGSAPVTNIDVISSRKLIAYTPRGVTGRQPVLMTNRYQQKAELPEETGFGYGLRPLAQATASLAHPTAVTVDQETGVAIATSGFFTQAFGRYDEELWELQHKDYNGVRFPDALRAVSYDVQGETHILQVGGVGNLPTGEEGQVRLARDVVRKTLEAKQLNEMIGMGEPLTLEEEEQLSKVAYENIATSLDSLSLQAVEEYEEGVQRKRLYVANGTAGISRLNLDEQNGMQLINEIGGNE